MRVLISSDPCKGTLRPRLSYRARSGSAFRKSPELSNGDSEQGGGYQQLLGHDRRVHTLGGGSNPPDVQPNAAASDFNRTLRAGAHRFVIMMLEAGLRPENYQAELRRFPTLYV